MKQNPGKWEGYSFYTWEAPVERCTTVVYSLSLQPVIAFVGGLEFDIMPAPIAEVTGLGVTCCRLQAIYGVGPRWLTLSCPPRTLVHFWFL